MIKVLVLTAGFGEGHNAAARHLTAACNTLAGPGAAVMADPFALGAPRRARLASRVYLTLINGAPRLWSGFYDWIDRRRLFPRHLWILRSEMRALAALIADRKPAVLCSTYPLYAFMLEHLTRANRLAAPYYNLVTDSISIHSLWTRPACTGWFVPNEDTAAIVRGMGVPPSRLYPLGFPVSSFFAEHAHDLVPPDPADGAPPRVLYIIHSGVRHAEETARRLIAESGWDLTFAVGRDRRLRARLERMAAGRPRPATILGWTDQVPRLLMTHHVVISKAGGATTQEAIAARCPMLVNQIVPGQEEGNYELLRRHRIGDRTETPDATVDALHRAFAHGGAGWRRWRLALDALARPNAGHDIAARLLARAAPPAFVSAV